VHDAGPPTCGIGRIHFQGGALNPQNACQSCQLAINVLDWTNLLDGSPCATDSICSNGACVPRCLIDGGVVLTGTVDATGCQICVPTASSMAWTNQPDGIACGASGSRNLCFTGRCLHGCFIGGRLIAPGTFDSLNGCLSCQPSASAFQWSPVTGLACGGGVCDRGVCRVGCGIGGAYIAPGARDPSTQGRCCAPSYSTMDWTQALQFSGSYSAGTPHGDVAGALGVQGLVVADFNGDGVDDLAVANRDDNSISVLLNNSGTFAPVTYPTGGLGPGAIAQGDLNGDGHPDLVAANADDGTLSVFLNDGHGGFALQATLGTGDGGVVSIPSLGVGDFNGDGRPDLVSIDKGNNAVFLFNLGAGGFSAPDPVRTGLQALSLALGRFRGGSANDLAVTGTGDMFNLLLNQGDGGFAPPVGYTQSSLLSFISTGDFNGDGLPDIALRAQGSPSGSEFETVEIALGQGDGTFQAAFSVQSSTSASWFAPVLADLDGDGRPEIVTCSSGDDRLWVVWQDRSGNLSAPVAFATGRRPIAIATIGLAGGPENAVAVLGWADFAVTVLANVCQ
jgi:hypothetical protein